MLSFSLSLSQLNKIVLKIKEKKELKGISKEIVINELNKYLKQNPKILSKLIESPHLKSKAFETAKKEIRKILRYYTGMFEIDNKKRKQLLEQNNIPELLKTHLSTKERFDYYDEIYKQIFKITKKPKSILDLGCGLNPLSLPINLIKNTEYFAADINQDDLEIVNQYFQKNHFKGDVFFYDLKNSDSNLPKTELCFLFKVLDLIDNKGHKNAEKLLKLIPAKHIVVSFPKITISGKKLNASRNWLKLLLDRIKYRFETFETDNEFFFVIKKF